MREVWFDDVLKHLRALLAAVPPLVEDRRKRRIAPEGISGLLEWTLPWGVDDGTGNVRLTLVDVPSGWGKPVRVRVVVAADAKSFGELPGGGAPVLPRYDERARRPLWTPGSADLARQMARHLLEHVDGDAGSLRAEAGGAVSFTVVVCEARTA
ncbi:hypothetical protein [Kitasatospora sp. SUK 42]|uniref:hypothetical protein n=1 Tax=Kitasatospora sp. SUK 42 TaxID=1588882 RepID=UPI0018C8FD26|nr:hypothetical protein [Kitasatospora sp. SUK 42]MBV2155429.1 hypothetical protein [Kitasatospora sp. SUK 42]